MKHRLQQEFTIIIYRHEKIKLQLFNINTNVWISMYNNKSYDYLYLY